MAMLLAIASLSVPCVRRVVSRVQQYVVKDQYIHQLKQVRVIVVGAGISGIAFAYKAKSLENVEYVIYEKNTDVGGTSTGQVIGPWPGLLNHFLEAIKKSTPAEFRIHV
ncbi:hypothetical protein AJ80_08761 [Polytolypa hystricis UAMH7299]|uniref:Uncharacterized protein n=1 Tax=Polytolypa hystricis (strain UAMH7299) TaxID=1447883 RepID=A0A2B7X1Z4_POLH7|nr:hypothetical protein AJ80_08761 [Polytolypa hystricis UAMH7299]